MYLLFFSKLEWFFMKMQCIKYFYSIPCGILLILIGEPFLVAKWFHPHPHLDFSLDLYWSQWPPTSASQGRNSARGRKFWTPGNRFDCLQIHWFVKVLTCMVKRGCDCEFWSQFCHIWDQCKSSEKMFPCMRMWVFVTQEQPFKCYDYKMFRPILANFVSGQSHPCQRLR